MDEPGASIPNLPRDTRTLTPDTSAIDLAPAGTDFSDCQAPPARAPEFDLAGLSLAPPGDEPLSADARKASTPPPPDTSHLDLAE